MIPLVTFFITRHFRKKSEDKLVTQSDMVPQKIKKIVVWTAIIIIIFISLYMWATAGGLSVITTFLPTKQQSRESECKEIYSRIASGIDKPTEPEMVDIEYVCKVPPILRTANR